MKPLFIIALSFVFLACKKNSKPACPPRLYDISCEESYPDLEFSGYLTGTNVYTIESNCPEDAIKKAEEMSYGYGQIYKRCHVVR
jgi:hypothetical protein